MRATKSRWSRLPWRLATPEEYHRYVADLFGRNRISDGRRSGLIEGVLDNLRPLNEQTASRHHRLYRPSARASRRRRDALFAYRDELSWCRECGSGDCTGWVIGHRRRRRSCRPPPPSASPAARRAASASAYPNAALSGRDRPIRQVRSMNIVKMLLVKSFLKSGQIGVYMAKQSVNFNEATE
ncbi:hypothetical protein EVAR_59647_1 [Eumeta japonica]|uniref:Uncharacterized protein n=1 Tax=Eumeta variegata TaxID=151549 RepID=A0A4C1YIW5_EUMVA|nr:hypothetical protein EVAR_59647_1 [Eumeta japonica]